MNPEQEELFDRALLQVLDRNHSQFGLGAAAVQVLVSGSGFVIRDKEQIVRRLDYLSDEQIGFVKEVAKTANAAVRTWKITAKGTDHLRSLGL